MKSLSEIETVAKRASKAAGYSWGISEEVGKNIRLLEMFGLPGIRNLNEYFDKRKEQKFENLKLIKNQNKPAALQYCPIISGTSFLDQIKSLDELKEIQFKEIAYPLLFLPFVSRASEIIGKKIFLKIDEKEFIFNFNQSIYSNYLRSEIIEKSNVVKINFIDNMNLFDENEWKELYKLSEDTFVDESETLKTGAAGAGLTDND